VKHSSPNLRLILEDFLYLCGQGFRFFFGVESLINALTNHTTGPYHVPAVSLQQLQYLYLNLLAIFSEQFSITFLFLPRLLRATLTLWRRNFVLNFSTPCI